MSKNDNKQEIKKLAAGIGRVFFLVALLTVVFVFVLLPMTNAWFSQNKKTNGNGMNASINTSGVVELACDVSDPLGNKSKHFWEYLIDLVGKNRDVTTVYSASYSAGSFIPGTKTGKVLTLKSTDNYGEITWWMTGEDCDFKDLDGIEGNLAPCAHGKLTFYVIVNKQSEGITCKVELTGFKKDESGSMTVTDNDNNKVKVSPLSSTDDEDIRLSGIINHHVLLFANHDADTGYYSDWLSDGTIYIDLTGVESGAAVEVSLYWVWAGYYDEFEDLSAQYVDNPDYNIVTLCEPGSADYNNLLQDMQNNSTCYFTYDEEPITVDDFRNGYNMADSELGAVVSHLQISVSLG